MGINPPGIMDGKLAVVGTRHAVSSGIANAGNSLSKIQNLWIAAPLAVARKDVLGFFLGQSETVIFGQS
jgi:hypothetical protein